MKRRSLITVLFTLICTLASWAGINKTLDEANSLFSRAKTVEQLNAAKKKFQSAAYDPGYNSSEHDYSIKEGVRKCEMAIERLTPRLTLNDQSYLNLYLKSDGGREYISVKTNAKSWDAINVPYWCTITDKSFSSFCLNYDANPNSYSRTGSLTIQAANGKEVRIDLSQRAGSKGSKLNITSVEFCNQDYDGNMLNDYGSTLYSSDIRYLKCKLYYNGLNESTTKTVYLKIYKPDGTMMSGKQSPEGYTSKQENRKFYSGSSSTELLGYGNNTESTYPAGTYRYEIWIDGENAYTAYPYISSSSSNYSSSGITITNAKFANTDYNSNTITDFGETMYTDDMRYLACKIYYNGGSSEVTKTLYIKIYKPDGTLSTGSSSPDGYTRKREVTFYAGSNNVTDLGGWGNSDESIYPSGTYRYEFWLDGKKIYTAHPYVSSGGKYSSSSNITITNAEFCNTDTDGNILNGYGSTLDVDDMRYLSCRIHYNGPSIETTKTVYIKMYDPDGELDRSSSSPEGYTRKREVTFKPGSNTVSLGGWGNSTTSTYRAGTYRYEIWIDGTKKYTAYAYITSAQSATFENIWADYDVYENGVKGMRVHVKCDIKGAKDHSCQVCLYFYDEDKDSLVDYDDSYDTTDGKVATHVTVTPRYENTSFSDIEIFMPYNQLHVNTYGAKKDFYYRVQIHDNETGKMLETSEYYNFYFSN